MSALVPPDLAESHRVLHAGRTRVEEIAASAGKLHGPSLDQTDLTGPLPGADAVDREADEVARDLAVAKAIERDGAAAAVHVAETSKAHADSYADPNTTPQRAHVPPTPMMKLLFGAAAIGMIAEGALLLPGLAEQFQESGWFRPASGAFLVAVIAGGGMATAFRAVYLDASDRAEVPADAQAHRRRAQVCTALVIAFASTLLYVRYLLIATPGSGVANLRDLFLYVIVVVAVEVMLCQIAVRLLTLRQAEITRVTKDQRAQAAQLLAAAQQRRQRVADGHAGQDAELTGVRAQGHAHLVNSLIEHTTPYVADLLRGRGTTSGPPHLSLIPTPREPHEPPAEPERPAAPEQPAGPDEPRVVTDPYADLRGA